MFRTIIRILLIGYFVAPVVALAFLIGTIQDMGNQLSPLYESASREISAAAANLQVEFQGLQGSFQPLVNAVNTLRSGLNSIAGFINDSVNAVIGWLRSFTFGAINLPRFQGITIPALVDLSFLNEIAEDLSNIGTQVSTVVTGTGNAVAASLSALVLVVVVLILWMIVAYILFIFQTFVGLWGRR